LLELAGSHHTAIKDFFPPNDIEQADENYGIENELSIHPSNINAETEDGRPHVIIPDSLCPFNLEQLERLQSLVDPLAVNENDKHGIELFQKTILML